MLDDHGGDALFLDQVQGLFDFVHDHGGQPLVRFVQQQHFDVAGKGAGDGQHLLFAARQGDALLLAALFQAGEQFVKAFQRPADRFNDLGQLQVFLDRQAGDDAPVLGHQRTAGLRCLIGAHFVQRLVIQPDFAVGHLWIVQTGDGAQGRCFTSPVAAQKGQNLALFDVKGYALHDIAFAIIGMQVRDREIGGGRGGVFGLAHGFIPAPVRQGRLLLPWGGL